MKVVGNENTDGIVALTASGTITDGKPVVVNYDGTCSQVSATGQTATKLSSTALTTVYKADGPATVYDPNSQKLIIAYGDDNDSNKGKVRLGTYNHATRTYSLSSPVTFFNNTVAQSGTSDPINVVLSKDRQGLYNRFVIIWSGHDGAWKLRAIVGTIVGDSVVLGEEAVIYDGSSASFISSCYYESKNVVLTAFKNQSDNKGYAAFLTVQGNFLKVVGGTGSSYKFNDSTTDDIRMVYSPTDDRAWIFYQQSNDVKCTVTQVYYNNNGENTFRFSSQFTVDSNSNNVVINAGYIPNIRKTVVLYRYSDHIGKMRLNSLNGNSDDISSNLSLTTSSAITYSTAANANTTNLVYDSLQEIFCVVQCHNTGSQPLQVIPMTFTGGDSVTIGTPVNIDTSSEIPVYIAATYNSDAKNLAIIYSETGVDVGDTAFLVAFQILGSNLSPYSFVGFSDGTYASGQKVLINSAGTIVNQTGHTFNQPYGYRSGRTVYVLKDGTIRPFSDNAKAVVGTSVSNNEILVKG